MKKYLSDKLSLAYFSEQMSSLFFFTALKDDKILHETYVNGVIETSTFDDIVFFVKNKCYLKEFYKEYCKEGDETHFISDDAYVVINKNEVEEEITVTIKALNETTFNNIESFCKKALCKQREKTKGSIYTLLIDKRGMCIKNVGKDGVPLIRENYTDEVLKSYDSMVEQLKCDKPDGRLHILVGPPGTGKSFMLRGLLSQISGPFIIIPSEYASHLSSPDFLTALIDFKNKNNILDFDFNDIRTDNIPLYIIIEDADILLMPRKSDNMSSISTILNFSDGLFGSSLDVRLILTTNMKILEFDEAITRPGRLCEVINLVELPLDKANQIYKRLVSKEEDLPNIEKDWTLAEIYSQSKDRSINIKPKKKLGF